MGGLPGVEVLAEIIFRQHAQVNKENQCLH